VKLVLAPGELWRIRQRFMPTRQKMEPIADLLKSQVDQRFETEGASGGIAWAHPKWIESIGKPDGRKLLHGRTGALRESWQSEASENSAAVFSNSIAAAVAQAGTRGKGGDLPDIVPKRAKKLFIPLTDRAASATPVTAFGIKRREALDGQPLVKGTIKGGRLDPPNADFLLLSKVSIPPRPQLPDGNAEREKQTDVVVESLASNFSPPR
jgi:phage gpG-like protein